MTEFNTDELYDPNEAARLLGIGVATLYRWINKNKLLPVRVAGRMLIPKCEIKRLNNNQATGHPVA